MKKRSYINSLPHCVYRHIDANGLVLYVGCTSDIDKRQEQHKNRAWWANVVSITSEEFPDKATAIAEEIRLIKQLSPPYNWKHSHDWDGVTPVVDYHPNPVPIRTKTFNTYEKEDIDMTTSKRGNFTPVAPPAKKFVDIAGGSIVVAKALGVQKQAVDKWKAVPATRVLDLERVILQSHKRSTRAKDRHDMRPDVFGKRPRAQKAS